MDEGRINKIEEQIAQIEARNKRVEADKAYETSLFRRILLTIITYLAAGLFFLFIEVENPWLAGLVPAGAYLLQNLTLPKIKAWWIKKESNEN